MADNKSREVIEVERSNYEDWDTFVTTADGKRFAVTEDEFKRLKGELNAKITDNSMPTPVLDEQQVLFETIGGSCKVSENPDSITVKINIDVFEALTGLKALQREAREATKALRELEEAQESYDWRKVACDNITRALEDTEATQSITDDIRRSYEIGGDGE